MSRAGTADYWQKMCLMAEANRSHFGVYASVIDKIIGMPAAHPNIFNPGSKKHAPIKAEIFMHSIDGLADEIYRLENAHSSYRDYFIENSEIWRDGLSSFLFSSLQTNEQRIKDLPFEKFVCDDPEAWHPPIKDPAGFAYALLRGFMSYFLVYGHFEAFKEVQTSRFNLAKKGAIALLLKGMQADESIELAFKTIEGCHKSSQAYVTHLAAASPEAKPADSDSDDDAHLGAAETKSELASIPSPPSPWTIRLPSQLRRSNTASPGSPGSIVAVASLSPREDIDASLLSSPEPSAHDPTQGRDYVKLAQQVLTRFEHFLSVTQYSYSYRLFGYTEYYCNKQRNCFERIKHLIDDDNLRDENTHILREYIEHYRPEFEARFSNEFHTLLTELVDLLQGYDGMKVSHLRQALAAERPAEPAPAAGM